MEPKPYAAAKFVNREVEVALVEGIVKQLAAGERVRARTVVFRGERGAGKTWLCLHLKRYILDQQLNVKVLLLSLFPPPETYAQDAAGDEWFATKNTWRPEETVTQIARWLAQQLGTTTAADATLPELSYWLTRDVSSLLGDKPLVLMVDSAYEADWEVLKLLETYILGPLAALSNTLLVITGRGRPYLWSSPALRIDAVDHPLQAFSLERVREQLERMGYDPVKAEEILALGGGHPLNTFLLMEGYGQQDTLNQVILELLSVLPLEDRLPVRTALEALCLLDGFVEDDIAPMLTVRTGDPSIEAWSMQTVRNERDSLVRTQMVQWQQGRFVIDEPLRVTVSNYLRTEAPDNVWVRLQSRALALYQDRAARFPKYAEHFLQKARRHCQALLASNIPTDCAEKLAATAE